MDQVFALNLGLVHVALSKVLFVNTNIEVVQHFF